MKKINILHFITELELGGAENLLLNMVKNLNTKKYNVIVVYMYGPGTLARQIESFGVKVVDLSRKGKIDPLIILKLFYLIKKKRIDIVHTHLVHASLVGRISAKLAGVRIILTTRHYAYAEKGNSIIYRLEKKTYSFNHRIIAVSKWVKNYMVRVEKQDSRKIVVIYNGVNTDSYEKEPMQLNRKKYHDFLVGSVGRLHTLKDYHTLIKSFSHIIKSHPRVKLVIVGDGPQKKSLNELVTRLGLKEKIIFAGLKMPQEVFDILRKIDLFALASQSEGFGLVIIEAMAMGKPVVATAVGGIREVVEEGITGFLVPPRNPEAIAEKIMDLIENKDLARRMGENGRQRVKSMFSINTTNNKLDELYQTLISKVYKVERKWQYTL